MNRRQSRRLSTSMDASFQIPLSVNSTVNNLLLEDDALENDFFDGLDYTITTPVAAKASSSSLLYPVLKSQQEYPKSTRSEQENENLVRDYDNDQMEGLGQTVADEVTPRGKRVRDPARLSLSPTPRARKNRNLPRVSNTDSRLPTSISRSAVRDEDFLTKQPGRDGGSSPVLAVPRYSSRSPSATPKPKKRRNGTVRAPPSTHSTPVGGPSLSSLTRPDKAQLQEESCEAEAHFLHHEHASSAHDHSVRLETVVSIQFEQTMPASAPCPTRDPRSPEKTPFTSSSAKRPSISQRRQSRSRTRSTSPSSLTRISHDVVMLPIQEEDEDLQGRGDEPPISKREQGSGSSAPREKAGPVVVKNDEAARKNTNRDESETKEKKSEPAAPSSSTADSRSSNPNAKISRSGVAKRGGDSLASQSVPKKRRTEVNNVYRDLTSIEDGKSRTLQAGTDLADVTPGSPTTAEVYIRDGPADTEPKISWSKVEPVAPEINFQRSSRSQVSYALLDGRPELLSTDSSVNQVRHEISEAPPDEVQDFLSRYAKKYGAGSKVTSNASPIIPKVCFPVVSSQSDSQSQVPDPPKRRDAKASKVTHSQGKATRAPAKPELKGMSKSKGPVRKKTVSHVEKIKVSNARFSPDAKFNDEGISKKIASRADVAVGHQVPVSELLDEMVIDATSNKVPSCSVSPGYRKEVPDNAGTLIVDVPSRQTTDGCSDGVPSCFNGTTVERDEATDPRTFKDSSSVSAVCAPSLTPGSRTVPPDSKTLDDLLVTTVNTDAEQMQSRDRSADGRPPEKPLVSSAVQLSKSRVSSEPQTDDMFARKKRDNYLRKGLDLTAHSSRRYVEQRAPMPSTRNNLSRARSHESSRRKDGTIAKPPVDTRDRLHLERTPASVVNSRSMATGLDLPDAGHEKNEERAPSDLECKDRLDTQTRRASRKIDSSKGRNKTDFQTRGGGGQTTKGTLSESTRGQAQKESNVDTGEVGNASTSSQGSAIAGRLMNLGQKIMGTFGLLSSHSEPNVDDSSQTASTSHLPDLKHGLQVSNATRRSDLGKGTATLPSGTLSPRTIQVDDQRAKLDESGVTHYATNLNTSVTPADKDDAFEGADDTSQGLRMSRKRSADNYHDGGVKGVDNDIELGASGRSRKRTRLSHDEGALSGGSSSSLQSDKPRHKITSGTGGTASSTRGLLASKNAKPRSARATARNAEIVNSLKPSIRPDGARRGGPAKEPCSLTLPMAPTFSTDVLRQQRIIAKSEREPGQNAEDKAKASKSDDVLGGKTKAQRLHAQTREPWKPTVPHAFRFETDTRQPSRKNEFEAKLKTWEQRANAGSSSIGHATSNTGLPDFKSRHAAQEARLAKMAAQRRELIAPTVPISPHFVVNTRLTERQKFEEARRAREKEAERVVEEQRRAKQLEEEREWHEARKRAVPRAHPVPDWYAQVPKRTAQSR